MDDVFLESEVVQKSLEDIMDLQMEVVLFSTYMETASIEEQKENLVRLRELQEKQKNMFFRCQLCKTEAANNMVIEVLSHFENCGYAIDLLNPISVFDEVEESLNSIEVDIRNMEENEM